MQAWEGAARGSEGQWVCVWGGGQGLTGEVKERGLLYLRTFLDKEKGKLPASEIKQEDFLKKDKPFWTPRIGVQC